MDHGGTTGLLAGGCSYGRHTYETGHSMRRPSCPIVDYCSFAVLTAVTGLKHWRKYIASHAISENNPEKSECQKGLSRFGKT
jgi:hypothetical protein